MDSGLTLCFIILVVRANKALFKENMTHPAEHAAELRLCFTEQEKYNLPESFHFITLYIGTSYFDLTHKTCDRLHKIK